MRMFQAGDQVLLADNRVHDGVCLEDENDRYVLVHWNTTNTQAHMKIHEIVLVLEKGKQQ